MKCEKHLWRSVLSKTLKYNSSVSVFNYIYIYIYIHIYVVITKKSPLSILRHLRVANPEFLKRFDGCLFQVSFYLHNFFSLFTIYYMKGYTHYTHTHTHTHTDIYIYIYIHVYIYRER